jgi:Raf kinase inhibitor-like YbhB/YbcL family protein
MATNTLVETSKDTPLDTGKDAKKITVVSPAFDPGEKIPRKYTADGDNVSPPLEWTALPAGTRSVALICDDPDAPKGLFTHWIVVNIPPGTMDLPENSSTEEKLPPGTVHCKNSFGNRGYGGPAPPPGPPHHYHFHVYALDQELTLPAGAGRTEVDAALQGHILAEGELVGLYGRTPT